ncbi:MAG: hypothetical protein JRE40_12745 [Deltaproteobacteria bacterium]|nr:hypothetical protein [Deltaproteobacteria bacterium]
MTQDKDRTPVAQNIATRCTKCKMELNHTVISHTLGGIVARVKCRTCGSEHKYYPEKKKATPRAARSAGSTATKTAAARKAAAAALDFEALSEKLKDRERVPYSMSGSFKLNDVIDHAAFGMGIVIKVSHQRIEVLFSDALKTLACDKG